MEGKQRPMWVLLLQDLASLASFLLLILVVAVVYQNLQATNAAVVEVRLLNTFFNTTLQTAQHRADSLRNIQRLRLDSLQKAKRQ